MATPTATPPLSPRRYDYDMAISGSLPPLPSPGHAFFSSSAPGTPRVGPLSPAPGQQQYQQPSPQQQTTPQKQKKRSRSAKVLRSLRSAFRALPILSPAACRFPTGAAVPSAHHHGDTSAWGTHSAAARMTGTLYGPRKARITLAIQDSPRGQPILLLELGVPTGKMLQDIGSGLARIALECERRAGAGNGPAGGRTKLLDEPMWTMYCNGRNAGYGAKREVVEQDLHVMRLLQTISMGAGVLPSLEGSADDAGGGGGELTYMRAYFDRVVGSRDSETFYMINPDSNSGPDLSIFFVRI